MLLVWLGLLRVMCGLCLCDVSQNHHETFISKIKARQCFHTQTIPLEGTRIHHLYPDVLSAARMPQDSRDQAIDTCLQFGRLELL